VPRRLGGKISAKGNSSLWQIWPRVFVLLFSEFFSQEREATRVRGATKVRPCDSLYRRVQVMSTGHTVCTGDTTVCIGPYR
jgi:hypothetical protein